jgi:SAM-dependent methyltransferase
MLGGDHTATVSVIEVLAPAFPDLRILHLDAHPDLREEFLGERYNYASALARVMDVVPPERVYQVGLRAGAREEYHRHRPHFFPMYPMVAGHPVEVVRRLLPELQRHPLYVTIDIDVLDPADAPGTGSPEPCGLRVPELLESSGCWRLPGHRRRPRRGRARLGSLPAGPASSPHGSSARRSWLVGDAPLKLREKSRVREYSAPRDYEIAFELNRKGEVDFLVHCFKRFSRRPVRRVVDIACGTGPHLLRLADRGYKMSGLDLSPRNIQFLRERFANKGHEGELVVGDMTDFRLAQPVDAAICMQDSQGHLLKTEQLVAHLRAVARCLKRGGLYVFDRYMVSSWTNPRGAGRGQAARPSDRPRLVLGPQRRRSGEPGLPRAHDARGHRERHAAALPADPPVAHGLPARIEDGGQLAGGFEFVQWFFGFKPHQVLEQSRHPIIMVVVLRKVSHRGEAVGRTRNRPARVPLCPDRPPSRRVRGLDEDEPPRAPALGRAAGERAAFDAYLRRSRRPTERAFLSVGARIARSQAWST